MTIREARQQLIFQLFHIYEEREARNIADLIMENLTEWKKIDRVLNKEVTLSKSKEELLARYMIELLEHKPVQYVLNEAWFSGMKLYVDENVLIPRPETEELVNWIISDLTFRKKESIHSFRPGMSHSSQIKILDVGTGSGCIAVALKKNVDTAEIYACDISDNCIEIAKKNAAANKADLHFIECDFLNKEERQRLPMVDVIISNPPYIPLRDKSAMHPNVAKYEPFLALFVSDDDSLQFYAAIADFSKNKLSKNGRVYVEIHEELARPVSELFFNKGFRKTQIRKDMQGKERMLMASDLF